MSTDSTGTGTPDNGASTPDNGSGGSGSSRLTWLLPALAFLLGLVLGGVVIGVGNVGGDDALPTAGASQDPEQVGAGAPTPSAAGLVVRIPQSCLDAADTALASAEQLEELAAGVRDLDARRVQEVVDRIQQLQPDLRGASEQCRTTAGERVEDIEVVPPAPSPSPVPSP